MENRLEALIFAYNIKPKKILKKKKIHKETSTAIKQSSSVQSIKLASHKVLPKKINPTTVRKQSTNSVQPAPRSNSEFASYPKERPRHNSSFDEDIMKLESLTVRNSNARLDLVSIQKRMIELGLNYNLNPILEIDESNKEKSLDKEHSADHFVSRIKSKQQTKMNLNSLKDLLVL